MAARTVFILVGALPSAVLGGVFRHYAAELTDNECVCNCCTTAHRRPAERNGEITTKCASMPRGDPRIQQLNCPERCIVVNDPILNVAHTVVQEQFCFYHCQPSDDTAALHRLWNDASPSASQNGGNLADAECVPLNGQAVNEAQISDQNGRDPEVPAGI